MEILIVLNSWATSACAQLFNADLSPNGEGYPTQSWMRGEIPSSPGWGVPHPVSMGVTSSSPQQGIPRLLPPCPDLGWRYPPSAGWGPYSSGPGMGYLPDLGQGTPPHPDLGWGPPSADSELNTKKYFWQKYQSIFPTWGNYF